MNEMRVLLVGIGGYGENYLKEFLTREIPNVHLVAIVDPFAIKSPMYQQVIDAKIPIYSEMDEFFDEKFDCELVIISSPIHTHFDYIMCALDHGCDVLCEKPVCLDLALMQQLLEKEKASGHVVAVGYQLCFSSSVIALKKDILAGDFGKPVRMKSLRLMRRTDSYYRRNGWAGKISCHGQPIFDSPLSNACAHQVQLMLYLLGDSLEATGTPIHVDGTLLRARKEIENFDAASLAIATSEGIPLLYYTAHCIEEKKVGPIGVYEFEKGTITETDDDFTAIMLDGTQRRYEQGKQDNRLQKLYSTIDAVRKHERVPCSLVTSVAHAKCVLLAQQLGITDIPNALYHQEEEDSYWSIPGLTEQYLAAYDRWELPSSNLG